MSVINNHGSIALKVMVNGQVLWIGGLGRFDDPKQLALVKEVDERIKRDRRAGRFSFKTAEEVRMYYLPTVEDQKAMMVKMLAKERSRTNSVRAVVREYQQAGLACKKSWDVFKLIPEHATVDSTKWLVEIERRYSTYITSVESCNKTLHIQAWGDLIEPMDKIPLLPY